MLLFFVVVVAAGRAKHIGCYKPGLVVVVVVDLSYDGSSIVVDYTHWD